LGVGQLARICGSAAWRRRLLLSSVGGTGLAGRRACEAENGPSPKKSRKKAAKVKAGDTAPTLTKNTVKKAAKKKVAKKAATGKAKKKSD